MDIIEYIFSGIIISFAQVYINSKLLNKKFQNNKLKYIIIIILLTTYMMVSYKITDNFVRPVLSLMVLIDEYLLTLIFL